jgi:hypothetical protein
MLVGDKLQMALGLLLTPTASQPFRQRSLDYSTDTCDGPRGQGTHELQHMLLLLLWHTTTLCYKGRRLLP